MTRMRIVECLEELAELMAESGVQSYCHSKACHHMTSLHGEPSGMGGSWDKAHRQSCLQYDLCSLKPEVASVSKAL